MKRNQRAEQEVQKVPELVMTEEGLTLTDGVRQMRGDFLEMLPRLKQANLERELLVKAARCKNVEGSPLVIDATAGMGEDSILLAAAGFRVQMYEANQVIGALLADALKRAGEDPALSEIAGRMTFIQGDSCQAMQNLAEVPDVIFLDPMFPERQKSASVKKKFQLLQQLERPCDNETQLLEAALAARPRKIVIKRPVKGPWLGERKPDYSLSGKAIRYDVIVIARNKEEE